MTHQAKNRYKALFLLIVFSLNTIAGFACSVGVDMGYNHNHHHGGKHHPKHLHKHNGEHHHKHSFSTAKFSKASNDDCCSNDVTKFALLDKSVVDNNLHLDAPVFFLVFTTTFLSPTINESGLAVNSKFQFVRRSSFLNDTDIQTAIRRFQI
jgi:hypothetical protein